MNKKSAGAVIVAERRTLRQIAAATVEPLTLSFAISLAAVGAGLGWHAHAAAEAAPTPTPRAAPLAAQRFNPPAEASAYVDALCTGDTAYLLRNTGESWGPMPWEPRLTEWALPCSRQRYLGGLVDRLGRDQFVFTLIRPDGTEVLYILTFGQDGRVAEIN